MLISSSTLPFFLNKQIMNYNFMKLLLSWKLFC